MRMLSEEKLNRDKEKTFKRMINSVKKEIKYDNKKRRTIS